MVKISRSRIDLELARIDQGVLKDWRETVVGGAAGSNTGSSYAINLTNGNVFHLILNANCTFTFTNPHASGTAHTFTLYLKQDGTGSRTVTWPGSVTWVGGSAPTLTTTINRTDLLTFTTVNGGTNWYGSVIGQDYS